MSALRNVLRWRAAGPGAGGGARALAWQSALIALVCVLADAVMGLADGPGPYSPPVWLALVGLVVLVDAALALPARLSGWVALANAGVQVVLALAARTVISLHGTGGHPVEIGSEVGVLIAGYRAGAWLRRWPSVLALAALVAGAVGGRWLVHDPAPLSLALVAVKSALLPWLVGRYTTARRAYIDELRHRRDNERRDAADAVGKAVARERTSIARDLHDVISHHVSAIGMHAGAARLALTAPHPTHPKTRTAPEHAARESNVREGAAREGGGDAEIGGARGWSAGVAGGDPVAGSLSAVEAASRAAMVDLRRLLDLLHGTADGASQPGLANLDELVTVGPPVRLTVHGGPRELPGSVDVALYRMAQEMLTNACRHGDGSTVDLEVGYGDGEVTLTARNAIAPARTAGPPRGAGQARTAGQPRGGGGRGLSRGGGAGASGAVEVGVLVGTGRGLAGIRTRVAMFGGSVRYGPDAVGRRWETSVTVSTVEER